MISVLTLWPDSFDFPLFRANLPKLQAYVGEVIICFTQHGSHPLRDWMRANISNVNFIDAEKSPEVHGDWRNKATHYLIQESQGDWLLFLEEDFLIKDYLHFFHVVNEAMSKYNLISFAQGNRFHPAFFLVKKELLHQQLDFTAIQDCDHFGVVSKKLKEKARTITLPELDLLEERDWYHLAGLTENQFVSQPYYRINDFYIYNRACLLNQVITASYWREKMKHWDDTIPQEVVFNEKLLSFLY